MAVINSYSLDTTVDSADKLIGSDGTTGVDAGKTKNFSIGSLASWIGQYGLNGIVSLGSLITTGYVKVTINTINAQDGGSTSITASNHFNFINFSGAANGTHSIILPSVVNGLILRFKTNGTVSNSKDIEIEGQTGQTIDGASTFSLDRGYDGISLLGNNGHWYIIQRKSK